MQYLLCDSHKCLLWGTQHNWQLYVKQGFYNVKIGNKVLYILYGHCAVNFDIFFKILFFLLLTLLFTINFATIGIVNKNKNRKKNLGLFVINIGTNNRYFVTKMFSVTVYTCFPGFSVSLILLLFFFFGFK